MDGCFFFILKNYFKNTNNKSSFKATIFCAIYFILSLNISEHLYWHSGAKVYLFPFIFFLFLLNIIVLNNKKQKKRYSFLLYLLTFMIIGSNEIIAVILCAVFYMIQQKNKTYKYLFYFSTVLLMISFLAPGNFIRLGYREDKTLFQIVKRIILLFGGLNIVAFFKSIFIVPLIHLFFVKEIDKIIQEKLSLKILLISFIGICSVALLRVGSQRTSDTFMIFYLIGISSILYKKYNLGKWTWLTLIIICLPAFKIKKHLFTFNYNVYDAVTDIINFEKLKGFKYQVIQRENYLEQSTKDSIVLKPIKNIPKTLYFHKIGTANDRNFGNNQLEKYYNKKSVSIKPD